MAAQRVYCLPVLTLRDGSVTTTEAPGASRPMRTAVECSTAAGPTFPLEPVSISGTTDAEAQMSETGTLPESATTRNTETLSVGGKTEVEPDGGSCIVVVVVVVELVVVEEVVVDEVVAPGRVVDVVVVVEVVVVEDVVVVGGEVVVVGSPVIRTTGGSTVSATITRSSWTCRLGMTESRASQAAAGEAVHEAGARIHLEAGRRLRPLDRGRERTKLT
jgi:hypothetical protein